MGAGSGGEPEISKRCQCVTRMPINEFFSLSILNIRQIEFDFFFVIKTGKTRKNHMAYVEYEIPYSKSKYYITKI